jgi:C4-dicarboxylate-specific signal transduction histidine kinase
VDRDAQWVRADPWALQQCLLNVLNNSADALKDRPDPKVSLTVSRQAGTVRIAVRDNGCGIPEKMMKNLFRPFHTTKEHGMGLGLVIVKKMLANMNGTINVESTKDVGTVVTITVPESGQ